MKLLKTIIAASAVCGLLLLSPGAGAEPGMQLAEGGSGMGQGGMGSGDMDRMRDQDRDRMQAQDRDQDRDRMQAQDRDQMREREHQSGAMGGVQTERPKAKGSGEGMMEREREREQERAMKEEGAATGGEKKRSWWRFWE